MGRRASGGRTGCTRSSRHPSARRRRTQGIAMSGGVAALRCGRSRRGGPMSDAPPGGGFPPPPSGPPPGGGGGFPPPPPLGGGGFPPPPPPGGGGFPPPPPPGGGFGAPGGGAPAGAGPLAEWQDRLLSGVIDFFGPWFVGYLLTMLGGGFAVGVPTDAGGAYYVGSLLQVAAVAWALYNGYLAGQTGQSIGMKQSGLRLVASRPASPSAVSRAWSGTCCSSPPAAAAPWSAWSTTCSRCGTPRSRPCATRSEGRSWSRPDGAWTPGAWHRVS